MKDWYLIYTKPRQEQVAVDNLINQGYEVYCPIAKLKNKEQALFPRYVFAHLDNKNQNWSPIRSTKGVVDFVRFGLKFAKIPSSIIETFMLNESAMLDKLVELNRYKKGDSVQIQAGAFSGQKATFYDYDGDYRVMVLIKLLQQDQLITLDEHVIKYF